MMKRTVFLVFLIYFWSCSPYQNPQENIDIIKNTPLYSEGAEPGKVYKFYGKLYSKPKGDIKTLNIPGQKKQKLDLTISMVPELPGKKEKVVYGYIDVRVDYHAFSQGLAVQSVFSTTYLAEDLYLITPEGKEIPVLFGKQLSLRTSGYDVFNETKVILPVVEELNNDDNPEEVKYIKKDDPYTSQQDYAVIYGQDTFPYYYEQIKGFGAPDIYIVKRYIPDSSEVVIVGRLTQEGIFGTPDQPTRIYIGPESYALEKLQEKVSD